MTSKKPVISDPIELTVEFTRAEAESLEQLLWRVASGGPISFHMVDYAIELLEELSLD